ncbi:MAG: S46 family peptidase [Rhodothermaceae bacterium]|nr:S46 family peptidase [Rhodothermaceae bacterium]
MVYNRQIVLVLLFLLVGTAAPAYGQISEKAEQFDNGKMWTFEYAPRAYFEETYDFEANERWFENARLGTLRIPGCTASFVSSYGLVLTNHHCSRAAITGVSEDGEDLLEDGFYAKSIAEERPIPNMYADQLVAIEDVTEEIFAATDSAQTDAERVQFREDAIAAVQARAQSNSGLDEDEVVVEVVPLYHGGRYSAYTFKRYTDLRMVLAPEMKIGYFGGDEDNFTFPRYTLDITFMRIYEEGEPFETEDYFVWSLEGAKYEEPVFVIGNPGTTSRLETVSQLELRRDVTDKNLLAFLHSRIEALESLSGTTLMQNEEMQIRNSLFSLKNARKAYQGQLDALHDPTIIARRKDAEKLFAQSISGDEDLSETYGEVIAEMAGVQDEIRALASAHGAFFALTSQTYSSALLRRAMLAYQYVQRQESGGGNPQLEELKEQIEAIPDQSEELGIALLAARLEDFRMYYGSDHSLVMSVLNGNEPLASARELFNSSALSTQESTRQFLEGAMSVENDNALIVVEEIMSEYQDFQSAYLGLQAQQDAIASTIGRARFEVFGTSIPPDATFSLRISDGFVRGYSYNGTMASPFTSYYGMYDHYYSYGPESDWDLPERWLEPIRSFDRSVPLNFSSTNDITGGNSGSPVINRDLELVGLIFDGNIESLSGSYIYLPEMHRSVSVDARGILEALDEIYQANRIVLELSKDELRQAEVEN